MDDLKQKILEDGAAIVGIGNLTEIIGKLDNKDFFQNFTRVISIGVRLSDEVIDEISSGPTIRYAEHYREINAQLDKIAFKTVERIKEMGYEAMTIPASKRYDQQKLAAKFPHKTAAIISGLGWIGRSALLISHEYGPRVRFTTVFTNMPSNYDPPQKISLCGSCMACVEACPAKAITGKLWKYEMKRSEIFDAYKCKKHLDTEQKKVGETICGICIAVCPYG